MSVTQIEVVGRAETDVDVLAPPVGNLEARTERPA